MKPALENLIRKEAALTCIFEAWTPKAETEVIPVEDAAGRVLAEDVTAQINLPVVRASAMDGVAVRSALFTEEWPDTTNWQLGRDYVRADTGDDFDDAFDAVIAIENIKMLDGGGIEILPDAKIAPGVNVRGQGSQVRTGTPLAQKGRKLTALDVAAIAMGGVTEITVVRRPRVGFIPTGSELVPVGTTPARGQNIDTNSLMCARLLTEFGARSILHPIVRDDPVQLEKVLDEMLPTCDILLLNAGTSKGGEDYCAALLAKKGTSLFQGVAAVPGRPMSAAIIQGKPVLNLSGPAFACFYGLDWAVKPMICRYLGVGVPQRQRIQATLTETLRTPPFFSVMAAFRVEHKDDGTYLATPLSGRGPRGVGSAVMLTADAIYCSTPGEAPHEAGDSILLELLR